MSREKQDDWKRTQVRMPQEQYDLLLAYAEKNNLSLNTAMLELIENGLNYSASFQENPEEYYLKELLELQTKNIELLEKVLRHQDSEIEAKEKLIKIYTLLKKYNIDISAIEEKS